MAKRRNSKRRSNKRRGGQPENETLPENGIVETQPENGIIETPPAVVETPQVAIVDVATAPEVSISGGGLIEIAVPAALIYSSTVLKKKFPSRPQYTSTKSRQILHWRKKHRKSRKTQRK